MRSAILLLLTSTAWIILPAMSFAHGLGVTWKRDGKQINVEAFYDDDTAADKAKIHVVNGAGDKIGEGVTDDDGKWSFPTPKAGVYEIHVDAGAGHRAKKRLEIAEDAPAAPPEETREEMTRTPWLRILSGLTIIAGGSGALMLGFYLTRQKKS